MRILYFHDPWVYIYKVSWKVKISEKFLCTFIFITEIFQREYFMTASVRSVVRLSLSAEGEGDRMTG